MSAKQLTEKQKKIVGFLLLSPFMLIGGAIIIGMMLPDADRNPAAPAAPYQIGKETPPPEEPGDIKYSPPKVNAAKAQKFASEAETYLGSCTTWHPTKGCMEHQDKFVRQYINALAGDYEAQKDVVFDFLAGQNDPDGGRGGAVTANQIQACAWQQVIAASGSPYLTKNDQSMMVLDCDGLRPMDIETAKGRAHAIARIISSGRVRPIAVPQIEYDPRSGKDEQSSD